MIMSDCDIPEDDVTIIGTNAVNICCKQLVHVYVTRINQLQVASLAQLLPNSPISSPLPGIAAP